MNEFELPVGPTFMFPDIFIKRLYESPLEGADLEAFNLRVAHAWATLTPREKQVLEKRFGFYGQPETLEQIGKSFSLTRERIRQMELKALRRIRAYFNKEETQYE